MKSWRLKLCNSLDILSIIMKFFLFKLLNENKIDGCVARGIHKRKKERKKERKERERERERVS